MIFLYAEKGDWEMVAKVRKGMRDKGVRKEVGYSWVDTGDADGSLYLHGFSSDDTTHPESGEICRMEKCLGLEMKILREKHVGDKITEKGLLLKALTLKA
ncbi:unnamed protein product [Prunus armeniaca]